MPGEVRIAYSLAVHKNEAQVQRLIGRIITPASLFYIKVFRVQDEEARSRWKEALSHFEGPNFHCEFSEKAVWGGFGQVQTTLDSMRYFSTKGYDYFINLSGQCYPLMTNREIADLLDGREDGYMEFFLMPAAHWHKGGMPRFHYHHIKLTERKSLKIPRLKRTLPYGLRPYGGANWFCLHRKHVDYILSYVDEHPKLAKFYRASKSPDEMFFQTILMNSPLRDTIKPDYMRYVDWTKKDSIPGILKVEDLPVVTGSGKMFARKFDVQVDSKVLDSLDEYLDRKKGMA